MSWKTEGGIRLGSETYSGIGGLRKIKHFNLPVVYLIQLGKR